MGFCIDVARLWVLYNEGGIYMDTDVEVYESLDPFLNEEGFTGFEDVHYPVTATLEDTYIPFNGTITVSEDRAEELLSFRDCFEVLP